MLKTVKTCGKILLQIPPVSSMRMTTDGGHSPPRIGLASFPDCENAEQAISLPFRHSPWVWSGKGMTNDNPLVPQFETAISRSFKDDSLSFSARWRRSTALKLVRLLPKIRTAKRSHTSIYGKQMQPRPRLTATTWLKGYFSLLHSSPILLKNGQSTMKDGVPTHLQRK